MAGYTRVDTINNIADGNVINAADLDGEFDGIQSAFNSSTGHNHDGTAGEGAPILALGPAQDVTISASVLGVKTTNTVDLGTSSLKFKDFYLAGAASIGGALTVNGNTTIGDADTDTITQAASYVTGTQLKSAKTATNTLSLAAYDVDGTAYTNLITLTASNTPTLALTSTGVGTINNMSIGATTASTGAFTTLTSNGATTFTAGTASTSTTTGTAVITGGLGVSGRINAANFDGIVGANTAAAGTFTSLSDSGNLTFTGTGNRITGDFSNATFTNRVAFQTSTTNSQTALTVLPNGTNVNSALNLYDNSDPTNAGRLAISQSTTSSSFTSGITGTGSYVPMTFVTGGSERARIDTSGNVGIGTTSPSSKLQIAGGSIQLDTSTSVAFGNINTRLQGASDGSFIWYGSGTERMRIDTSGNVLVGATSTLGGRLSVKTSGATNAYFTNDTAGGYNLECDSESNAGTYYFVNFRKLGTGISNITSNGTTVAYNTGSDYRLKENIQPITNALDKVSQLKPCKWDWQQFWGEGSSQGFVAHELQEVVPDCVTGAKDAVDLDGNPVYQGVDSSFLVATLTAAIQEQQALITALTARITALESK